LRRGTIITVSNEPTELSYRPLEWPSKSGTGTKSKYKMVKNE